VTSVPPGFPIPETNLSWEWPPAHRWLSATSGRSPPVLAGRYRINRTEYYPALRRFDDVNMVAGYLGTCLHFVTPVDRYGEAIGE
jgi:hypothetical protein